MTKAELSQYRSIAAEIVENEERIRESTLRDSVRGSCTEFPYTERTVSVEGLGSSGDNSRLLKRQGKLKRQKRRIEDFIDNIPDSETRRIFRYRYIVGKRRWSWQKITFKIGGGNTADGVRMIHNRYLEKIIDKKKEM